MAICVWGANAAFFIQGNLSPILPTNQNRLALTPHKRGLVTGVVRVHLQFYTQLT